MFKQFRFYIAIIVLITYVQLNPSTYYNQNTTRPSNSTPISITCIEMINFCARIAASLRISVENDHNKQKQRLRNKAMHSKNGNRNKNKNKTHLKLLIVNKGNSNYCTNKNIMINLVETEQPDIMVVSEANLERENNNLDIDFKKYNVESKFLGNNSLARIMVTIKKGITYERMSKYDNDVNAMIVLKVKTASSKYVFLVCVYRQWRLINETSYNSNHIDKQVERLHKILGVISDLRQLNNEVICMGDLNIDLWPPNDPGQRPDIKKLSAEYLSVMNQQGMCQVNFKPTRIRLNSNPSLIDHYFASNIGKIDSVETKATIIADHHLVKCQYHSQVLRKRTQFRRIRDSKLITTDSLTYHITNNQRLQTIFELEDPEVIAATIIAEINRIIEDIAPSKVVQMKDHAEPWKDEDVKEIIGDAEKQLEKAINTNNIEEWRWFKSLRNQAFKFLEIAKRNYFIQKLSTARNIWREFKIYKGEQEESYPVKIVEESKEITSPKKMADLFSKFFIEKIEDIRTKFKHDDNDQIPLLEKLVDRPKEKLEVDYVSINEMYDTISTLKTSNSCGFDQMSSKIIKMIPEIMAFWLTHLLNQDLKDHAGKEA